jgi:hypothetical protein
VTRRFEAQLFAAHLTAALHDGFAFCVRLHVDVAARGETLSLSRAAAERKSREAQRSEERGLKHGREEMTHDDSP